jgi:catechol 2,3-dioxygenase-like lactoylglutathione lyase family enzyme
MIRVGQREVSHMNGNESFIVGLDHIQLAMPPGQESVADSFYCDVLGFQRMAKPSHLEKRGGRWFVSNGVQVHLGVEQEFAPARKAHPGLVVNSLEKLKERLEAAGVAIVLDTQILGFERFYASDPFGNRLEFMQPVAASAT